MYMHVPRSRMDLLLCPEVPHLLERVRPLSLFVLARVVPLFLRVPKQEESKGKQIDPVKLDKFKPTYTYRNV